MLLKATSRLARTKFERCPVTPYYPITPTIVFMLYKSVDLGFDRGMKMKYLLLILILVGYGAYLQIMSSAVDAQLANLKHMYSDIPAQIVSSN